MYVSEYSTGVIRNPDGTVWIWPLIKQSDHGYLIVILLDELLILFQIYEDFEGGLSVDLLESVVGAMSEEECGLQERSEYGLLGIFRSLFGSGKCVGNLCVFEGDDLSC